ncbi:MULTISPECIES: GNAT family N-acetyltransferase [Spirosoma]|uniref:GNAT family N-acetyltransferase n=1 Tax=Spirosoma liriopis TaxID=2937440 RepID=A0ABT0HQS5_9BACT|nr:MULTISPECIES: GNAT family N-acetyltransferase [Spirosoma]MCK8494472.1 GNAT family N-acetyltransferase [Spirosoma liriopis]UHG89481.1 GNAT family N-acetyltransferase [Spirosoma oryzicola]
MISIRPGTRADVPQAFALVTELAVYELAADQVSNTAEQMADDGFGANPLFGLLVAEESESQKIVGIALYYFRYSTWKGKRLYLEDIIVTEDFRGYGIGKLLLDATIEMARETHCTGMMWQVLDWNKPAIGFYQQFGTRFDDGWTNCHLDF